MHYQTQEFRFELPQIKQVTQDRSVNVLSITEPERGIPCQLIISRDQLLGSESLQESFERQVGVMSRQTQGFKTQDKRQVQIGTAQLAGFAVESTFTQSGKTFHQMQAMFVVTAPKLLVLTLSSHVPLNDGHRQIFQAALDSLVLNEDAAAG